MRTKAGPSQIKSVNDEVLALRNKCGYFPLSGLGILSLQGKDAISYLQGRTTNDIKSLKIGSGCPTCFLDRQGHLQFTATACRLENSLLLITDQEQAQSLLAELEQFKFRENVEFTDLSNRYHALSIEGPQSEAALEALGIKHFPNTEYGIIEITPTQEQNAPQLLHLIIRQSNSSEQGFLLLYLHDNEPALLEALKELSKQHLSFPISKQAYRILGIEAGRAKLNIDISNKNLLPETGLEQTCASYTKGCFIGQEVLARIKTYGAPKQALVGLIFENGINYGAPADTANQAPRSAPASISVSGQTEVQTTSFEEELFALHTPFSIGGKTAGEILSNCYSPTLQKYIALAFIQRDYRVPEKELQIFTDNKPYTVKIHFLPFYTARSHKEKAKELYLTALKEFATGSETKAINDLRHVLELDPQLTEAYEALGVALSKQDQLDEAIALMYRLAEMDPESVLAHTNLSVFYMQQGNKEKAEEEKALAMGLQMTQMVRSMKAKQEEEKQQEENKAETERRVDMFKQVLAIDSEDFLANAGLGALYVENKEYEQAIPYLEKALATKPNHTTAYLALGRAYTSLDNKEKAKEIFTAGIEIAGKRGDLGPMKEMQELLASLLLSRA